MLRDRLRKVRKLPSVIKTIVINEGVSDAITLLDCLVRSPEALDVIKTLTLHDIVPPELGHPLRSPEDLIKAAVLHDDPAAPHTFVTAVPSATCLPDETTLDTLEVFRGHPVILAFDNDKDGESATRKLGKSLQGIAASVRTVNWEGIQAKDITEFRDNGGNVLELIAKAKPWEPGSCRIIVVPARVVTESDRIILPSGKVSYTESAKNIFQIIGGTETMFCRGDCVVELVTDKDGSKCLDIVTPDKFRSRIERYAPVYAWRAGPHGEALLKVGAKCSKDIAKALLNTLEKEQLPPLQTIHAFPLLLKDGDKCVFLPEGYHREGGGRLILGGDAPVRMTANEGAQWLLDSVAEYQFATEADKSRAIAAMISPALLFGDFLPDAHFPVFVIEADESQTGKGYFLEQIQAFYGESASMVVQREGGVGGLDESLSQAMISGHPFIQFDNVRGRINSGFLEMVLTCPKNGTVGARVPHKGEIQVNPNRFILQLTSNGLETTPDFANRSCIIRIQKRRGHTFRTYPEGPDLIAHIKANQARFLGAIHAVVNEWVFRGSRGTDDTRATGRFRTWTQKLDWIVRNLCELVPLMDGHEVAQERVSTPAITWLREVCIAAEKDGRLGVELSAAEIAELCADQDIKARSGKSEVDWSDGDKANMKVGTLMKSALKGKDRIEIAPFEIRKREWKEHGPKHTFIRKSYEIAKN